MGEFLPPYDEASCRRRIGALGLERRVELLGCLEGASKWEVFSSSHVFAFSSVAPYESFGLVMAEAMMWGMPLVATDWRGNREVAGDAALYASVGQGLVESLSRTLAVACEPAHRARLARLARRRFVERYLRGTNRFSAFVARRLGL
jgi:glycosyltransferase involved in cell wall biosynthesis